MKNLKKIALGTLLLASVCVASAQSLTVATGEAKKGFSKLFANINDVCGTTVPLKELNTNGGLENVGELANKNAVLGLVPVDIYQTMEKTDDAIGRLKAVMSLNSNLLHVVVSSAGYQYQEGRVCDGKELFGKCTGDWKPVVKTKVITTMEDLKGRKVAAVGSAQVLARSYFNKKLGYGMDVRDVDPDAKAFELLKKGEVDAVLTMAAYPAGGVSALKQDSGLTLVDFNLPASGVYKVTSKNYKNLGVYGRKFLAVPNLLMARPVDPNGETGQQITRLKACISSNLKKMQDETGFEPSWSDVTTTAVPDEVPTWTGVLPKTKK